MAMLTEYEQDNSLVEKIKHFLQGDLRAILTAEDLGNGMFMRSLTLALEKLREQNLGLAIFEQTQREDRVLKLKYLEDMVRRLHETLDDWDDLIKPKNSGMQGNKATRLDPTELLKLEAAYTQFLNVIEKNANQLVREAAVPSNTNNSMPTGIEIQERKITPHPSLIKDPKNPYS